MRSIIIVLDGVGVGALPDAGRFHDEGSNTLGHVVKETGISLPNLCDYGLGCIDGTGLRAVPFPKACYGKSMERFEGKDTTGGHWEIAGHIAEPFQTFSEGFPQDIIDLFMEKTGVEGVLGNVAASGTEIIRVLGDEHVKTGYPIVYTSADSVFQIAAHEDVIPIGRLYDICAAARDILMGPYLVGRVIARPFEGESGQYQRTQRRRDFSVAPTGKTLLDAVAETGMDVLGIGKIEDIFAHRGLTRSLHTTNNHDSTNAVIDCLREDFAGLVFANLVDFDTLYGHRNDVHGFARALCAFDERLPDIIDVLHDDDLLILTADHGCDPTTKGTDHTREYVPVLAYAKWLKKGVSLGIRNSFADITATICEYLGLTPWGVGESFLQSMKEAK
ncbi:MAG: phosphopentomutase [Christensenellales bacterium]|jgi:phosphopentomutase